jgi:putative transposase
LVDTLGLVLDVQIHAANIADRDGARPLVTRVTARHPCLTHLWVDQGYSGTFASWATTELGLTIEMVKRPRAWQWCPPGVDPPLRPQFTILPRRWVVERTFAWLGRYRRMSKDYEALPDTQRTMIHLCMIRLMLRRLAS